MWANGARREHDIAFRKVLQYTACLRRRGAWGLGYEGGDWGSRVPVRQATLLTGFELDATFAERTLATCIITLHQQVVESQTYPMCSVFVMQEGHSQGSLHGSHSHSA